VAVLLHFFQFCFFCTKKNLAILHIYRYVLMPSRGTVFHGFWQLRIFRTTRQSVWFICSRSFIDCCGNRGWPIYLRPTKVHFWWTLLAYFEWIQQLVGQINYCF
jgi:hypothetical protein